ncbi:hypothetical protein AAFG13_37790 [Bradyrhizobium sp. B124]|uniref:hypothetical protein n=1 Tax=Bradyrhizobium sp. B124 TaxID=3140245 RepID=UPI0031837CCC
MDPFNSINPFDRDFAAYNAAVPQPQQQQAEFEPYLDEVPQLDTTADAGVAVSPDRYYSHLFDEDRRLTEALELGATARDHQAPDPGEAVRHFDWSNGYQPAANELSGSTPSSSHEVLMGEDYTGELRPAKRQRTLSHTEGDAIGRQLSESGNSVAPVLMEHAGAPSPFAPVVGSPLVLPAEGYDQALLWAMMEDAGPSPSREPTARHNQALDLESVVRPFNFRQGDQHASAALDPSNVPPSQDSRSNSFIVHNDRYTALFVPAAAMRRSTPLNPPGAAIPLRSRPENVPQPGAQRANRASLALLGRSMEQAAPASAIAETTPPAARDIYAATFAVPEGFSHGTQPAPYTMISKLGRWGLLPDAAQPIKRYDIHGELYTALAGPGGPNDIRLIHHPGA